MSRILESKEKDNNTQTLNQQTESGMIYAALMLIKYLYKQGKIKRHIYKNILNDYADCIDISDF